MKRIIEIIVDNIEDAVIFILLTILGFVILSTFASVAFARLELDSAKRMIIAEIEESNRVDLPVLEKKIKEKFKPKRVFLTTSGEIQFAYGDNQNKGGSLNKANTGYLGRSLELVIYREVKLGWLKEPIIFSTGVSVANRNVMSPTKDIEYRVGEEYM